MPTSPSSILYGCISIDRCCWQLSYTSGTPTQSRGGSIARLQGELERLILTAQDMLLHPSQCHPQPTSKPQRKPKAQPISPQAKPPSSARSPTKSSPEKQSGSVPARYETRGAGGRPGAARESADGSLSGRVGGIRRQDGAHEDAGALEEDKHSTTGLEAEDGSESGSFRSTNSSPEVQLVCLHIFPAVVVMDCSVAS